jgi:predicted ATPase
MPELDSITIKGFKSISSIEKLSLKSINILIGANGSGKSNFISVFSFLNAIREGHLQEYVIQAGGAEKLLHFGSKVTDTIDIFISFQDGKNQYDIVLRPTDNDELVPISETGYFWDKKYPRPYSEAVTRVGKEAGISDPKSGRILKYVRGHLSKWRLYHFHDTSSSSPMKKMAEVNDNRYLRPDGSNIAPFLYFLKLKHETSYSLIRRTVQNVAPFFNDFLLEPLKLNEDKILLEWQHNKSNTYFDASSISDGTLRYIALATLFLQPIEYRPSVILVDEPELGLHPYAIAMLASLIKQASTETQVIISTQSSLLLDHFQAEDVLVADLVNQSTEITRLDSEKYKNWLEEYSLGQLWEKNQFGGRPNKG